MTKRGLYSVRACETGVLIMLAPIETLQHLYGLLGKFSDAQVTEGVLTVGHGQAVEIAYQCEEGQALGEETPAAAATPKRLVR